jgi:N-methylhydantoinase B
MERAFAESETLMRAAIRELPDGTYAGEDFLDGDGVVDRPVRVAVDVTIQGDSATFDFSRSDPQVAGPMNASYFMTCAGAYYSAKALFGPGIPTNDGCYRPLTVIAPRGSVLNPEEWAPRVGGNHETSMRVVDAIFRALAPVMPERVTAGGTTTAMVIIISGRRLESGTPYVFYECHGGGEGGQASRDGANAIRVALGNTMNTPIEAVEAEYPLLVQEYSLRPGSGGAGRRRGGTGLRRSYRLLAGEAKAVTLMDRCKVPPWGVFGGEPGKTVRLTLNPGTTRVREVGGMESLTMREGGVLQIETVGGGGFGPPADRPAELLEADRRMGYVEDGSGGGDAA